MRLKEIVFLAVISLLTTGCANLQPIPLTPEAAAGLKNKEVVRGQMEKPPFVAVTADKAMFAMFGAVAMISAGKTIAEENHLQDPAPYINEKLSLALSKKYGTKVTAKTVPILDNDIQALAQKNPGMELVLEIRTTSWNFIYFPTTWGKYRVTYTAMLRLLDIKDSKVIAQGLCSYQPDETPTSPTYDELLANSAERLKREIILAADFCINDFKTKTLQL